MSFAHSNQPKIVVKNKSMPSSEFAVTITKAFIDANNHIKIDYEVDSKINFSFICVTDSDAPNFGGRDWAHPGPKDEMRKGTFFFELGNNFPFETARICLYGNVGRNMWSPTGAILVGKSQLIKECLNDQLIITPPGGKSIVMNKKIG